MLIREKLLGFRSTYLLITYYANFAFQKNNGIEEGEGWGLFTTKRIGRMPKCMNILQKHAYIYLLVFYFSENPAGPLLEISLNIDFLKQFLT